MVASSPASIRIRPESRASISTIVAIAATLIRPLRQNPCRARRRLKAMKANMSAFPVICGADLVSDDSAVLERHDPLPQSGHHFGVVGRHQHRYAHLVDPQQQLDDLP